MFFILRIDSEMSGGHRTPRFVFDLILSFTVAPSPAHPARAAAGAFTPHVRSLRALHVLVTCHVWS